MSSSCNCANTGYEGNRCHIGIVTTPRIPKLKLGIASSVLTLNAKPSVALKVSVNAGKRVTIKPSPELSIDYPRQQANFTVRATSVGVHLLSYNLSGPSKNDFITPAKSVFLVEPASSSQLNVFEKLSLVNKELPTGKYSFQDTISFPCNLTFSSTDTWQKNGGSVVTSGIVYANTIPLSLIGTNLANLTYVRNNVMETLSQKADVTTSGGIDFLEYLQYDSFPKSFIKHFMKLAPRWFVAVMKANSSAFSIYNTFVNIGVQPFSTANTLCDGFPTKDASATTYFLSRVPVEINIAQAKADLLSDSVSCFAVSLCTSELFVGLSKSNIGAATNLAVLKDMKRKGWELQIQALGFSHNGDLRNDIQGVTWNGLKMSSFLPFKPRMWLRGHFKVTSPPATTGMLEVSLIVDGQVAINVTALDDVSNYNYSIVKLTIVPRSRGE